MKKIIFSFDDGRKDTFDVAFQIIKEFGLTATINVATDFVEHPDDYRCFSSANGEPMSVDELKEAKQYGIEIACHGHKHTNSVDDLIENIDHLRKWGLISKKTGFASPFSKITKSNLMGIDSLLSDGTIAYIRSGRQVRREGFLYSCFYFLMNITKSKRLFYILNKRSLISPNDFAFYYGISITNKTTLKQIKYIITKMPDEYAAIFIFHSILRKSSASYGVDKWYWDACEFRNLCSFVKEKENIKCITNMELNDEKKLL